MAGLRGRRVAITRAEGPDGPLASGIREAGGIPLPRPTIRFRTLLEPEVMRAALEPLTQADWLLLTSPRAVHVLAEAGVLSPSVRERPAVAAVGPQTVRALEACGWSARISPEAAGGAQLLEALLATDPTPATVLFPASAQARPELPEGLRAAGFTVTHVPIYEPAPRPQDPDAWSLDLREGLEALTISSPSAVAALSSELADAPVLRILQGLPAVAQGPTSGAAARDAGWRRVVEAEPHTFAGVVTCLEELFADAPSPPSILRNEVNA